MISRFDLRGVMSYVSPSSLQVLGFRPDELVGRSTWEFVHPADRKALGKSYEVLLASGEGSARIHTQFRVQKKSGELVWIEGSPKLIRDATGAPTEVIDIARDITARKNLEAELEAARFASEAGGQAKADFLANMSHELRTPLNSVIGFSRLIADAPELQPETRRRAILARDASQALLTIVNDILDFSRFETEGVKLAVEPMELNDLIGSVADLFRDEVAIKGVALVLDLPRQSTRVLVDSLRLRQVLMNLVGNAVKFTQQGSVTISLSRDAQGLLKFAVRDTGVGIPMAHQSAIFERFTQADASVVRRFGGSGLGLTISRTIVEAMGGKIGLFSSEGAGSTFWFTVNLPEAAQLSTSGLIDERPRALPSAKILLVDDHPPNCELFKALLNKPGLAITCAGSGAEAIDLVQSWPFDIVFMDVQMPEMDGLEATRRLRGLGFEALPIIALSANVLPANIQACLSAGMNGHLGKPFSVKDIVASIEQWARPGVELDSVDENTVDALTRALGSEKMDHFLNLLADQLTGLLKVMNSPTPDIAEIGKLAHSVRGYAGSIGFSEVGMVLEKLEAACSPKGDPEMPLVRARCALAKALKEIAAKRAA